MKHTNANVTKQLTILTSVILSLIFAFAVSISFIAINNKKDVFTVCNDDEYYSETTYFLNEKEYEKYLRETGTERDGEKSAAKRAASAEQDGEIFVQAAVKKVWVAEAKDDSGNVVNSRLMKKAEIDKIPVAGQYAHLLRGTSDHGLNHLYRIVKHIELYAYAAEIALQRFGECTCGLRIGIGRMRIESVEHGFYGLVDHVRLVDRIDIVSADHLKGVHQLLYGKILRAGVIVLAGRLDCRHCSRRQNGQT